MRTACRRTCLALLLTTAAGCTQRAAQPHKRNEGASPAQPPHAGAEPAATSSGRQWAHLCPSQGASPPSVVRATDASVRFEPSGAAVWNGRVAIVGDKQARLWWWTPGTGEVAEDIVWRLPDAEAAAPDSCCASAPSGWGNAVKREKALETCGDHGVKAGTGIPWLKAEGLTATTMTLFVVGNMGFGCRENSFILGLAPGQEPMELPTFTRDHVLEKLQARDVRVEGIAMPPDGSAIMLAVRQLDVGNGDQLSMHIPYAVGLAPGAFEVRTAEVVPPTGGKIPSDQLGLSDITVLADNRVAITVSKEANEDGKRVVAGELWVTRRTLPWSDPGKWEVERVAEYDGHKPEAVVQLAEGCVAVFFDDDEKFKQQNRQAGGGPEWDSSAAFVSYVAVPPAIERD